MFKKSKILIALGLLTAILPLLGFPGTTRDTFVIIFSLTISVIGFIYLIEERKLRKKNNHTSTDNQEAFIDNGHKFVEDEVEETEESVVSDKINFEGDKKTNEEKVNDNNKDKKSIKLKIKEE
jgi:hypothetical protein